MTATTKDRQTPALRIHREIVTTPKANVQIPAGVMVTVLPATGLADNGANVATQKIIGRSAHSFDNTAAAVPPDVELICETGIFAFTPSANLIAAGQAAVLGNVYVVDNQTIGTAADGTNAVIAGRLEEIKDGRYYVAIGMGV